MSSLLLAFLVSLGASTWVFTKLQNRTGAGNNGSAIKATVVVFIVAFILVFTIAHSLLHK
ncbi:MAG TPA: hypothetical protein VLF69_05795 [Candidatus Saccharimonadales bacterium]|nr:hypothetical protein [Candidatus Saccharimonadales bacterium]